MLLRTCTSVQTSSVLESLEAAAFKNQSFSGIRPSATLGNPSQPPSERCLTINMVILSSSPFD